MDVVICDRFNQPLCNINWNHVLNTTALMFIQETSGWVNYLICNDRLLSIITANESNNHGNVTYV